MTCRSFLFSVLLGVSVGSASGLAYPSLLDQNAAKTHWPTKASIPAPSSSEGTPNLLVLPFENSAGLSKLDWLREGLAELTADSFAGAGQSVVPRDEVVAATEGMGLPTSTRYSRATMLKIAEEADADYIVFGRYASDGKRFSVNAQVLRVKLPRLAPAIEESGPHEELFGIHARLAGRLLALIDPGYALRRSDSIQKQPSTRLDALEHSVRGRQFLAAGQLDVARRELGRAILLAPLDSVPRLGLAEVYRRQKRYADAVREIRVVLANQDGAATRTTLAQLYLEQNQTAAAREELRVALKLNPNYSEARRLLEQLEARTGAGGPR